MFSSAWAWTSTPGRLSPSGVTCWSPKPSAVTPTRTSFRSRRSGATSPASTAAAETNRETSCGVKWTHIVPSALGGDPDVADAHRAHAAAVAAHAERRRPRGDPEHLDGEPGDQRPVDRGHEREPAHDPARHVGAQEGVPRRAAVDVGHAAEHRPVAPDLARRILRRARPPA